MPFLTVSFFGEGSPTKIDYRKQGTLVLTSLLEDLGVRQLGGVQWLEHPKRRHVGARAGILGGIGVPGQEQKPWRRTDGWLSPGKLGMFVWMFFGWEAEKRAKLVLVTLN